MTRLLASILALLAALGLPSALRAQDGPSRVVDVVPYIEAAQVLTAELEPGNDVVTYTQLAAGVDAQVAGRFSAGSVSLRYERRIGWGEDTLDGDTVSGIARGSLALVPGAVTLEAGGLAARTRVDGNGGTSLGGFGGNDSSTSQIYSVYAGPSVNATSGAAQIEAHYRLGYTRVEAPDAVSLAPGAPAVDFFDDSVTHAASARVGFAPDTVLPVIGVGVGGGWNEQTISNLDQRVRDRYARADVTLPVSPTLALVGGVGYEDVQISSRDALRDGSGNPVVDGNGRFVTDPGSPRLIAYETDGLIWDAGVLWRPSRRTSLEAHVGRRYGSTTYYGSFNYAPSRRTSINISVYDNLTGFGGALVDRISGLPTRFEAFRNPISGAIGGCVVTADGDGCLGGALGSIRSAVFRSRGVAGSYAIDFGRMQMGVGAGYDRRSFIAAAGSALAEANGVADENVWLAAYANTRIDAQSSIGANANVNWFDSGFDNAGGAVGYSASLAYYRDFIRGLTGTAAVSLDGITRRDVPDYLAASALVGLRYSFR